MVFNSDKLKRYYFLIFTVLLLFSLVYFFYFYDVLFFDFLKGDKGDVYLVELDEFKLLDDEEYHFFFLGFENVNQSKEMVLFFNSRKDNYVCNVSLFSNEDFNKTVVFYNLSARKRQRVYLNLGDLPFGYTKFIGNYSCESII